VPVLVGVDAGGTSIECAIERDGRSIRRRGEPANVRVAGVARAAERIAAAVRGELHDEPFAALAVGAAGAGDPAVARALETALREHFASGAIAVCDDAEIALRAGVPDGDGAVLIAGTGSITYARVGERSYRAGGYGYLLGDDGSGFAIGRSALAQLLRSYDERVGREPLFEAIEAHLDAADARAVLARVYRSEDAPATIAALAPLVIERASAGERLASKIVQSAASELVELVKALVGMAHIAARELPLVYAGGLFAENSLLTFLVETRITADLPLLQSVKPAPPPVQGALELARRIAAHVSS